MPHDLTFKKKLHTNYFYPNPERIRFASFNQEGQLLIEALLSTDIQERMGQRFEWTENLLISHNMREKVANWEILRDSISVQKLQERMDTVAQIQEKLAIIEVNHIVGFGLIATDDIPKNTVVTFYAGQFMGNKIYKEDDYSLGESTWTISAKYYRNYAAFIMHAPYRDCIDAPSSVTDSIYLSDFDLPHDNVVSANLKVSFEVYGLPYIFLESIRPIKKGEFLAWDYGLGYWEGRGFLFSLVNTDGKMIDPDSYHLKKEIVFFEKISLQSDVIERKMQFENKKINELDHLYHSENNNLIFFKKKMARYLKHYTPWHLHKNFSKTGKRLKKSISKLDSFYEMNQLLDTMRKDLDKKDFKEDPYYETVCNIFSSLVFKN